MATKKPLVVFLSLALFGFASEPYSPSSSYDTSILIVQAKAGDAHAQFQLAAFYDSGIAVRRSTSKAKKWYRLAALNGHAEAQNSLGSIYQEEKNYIEAREWYEHAANLKHPKGITNLANLYDLGLGVLQNKQKAYVLYLQAAKLGDVQAMVKLGQTAAAGQLAQKYEYQGCVWTYRAECHLLSSYRSTTYKKLKQHVYAVVNYCEQTLSENQVTSAKQEAVNWRPRVLHSRK